VTNGAYLLDHLLGDGLLLGFLYFLPKDSGFWRGCRQTDPHDGGLEPGKQYLEIDLGGPGQNPRLGNQTARIDEQYRAAALNRQTLNAISQKTSPDFAALFLIKQLLSNPRNL
jgi:hypothetical protein